PLGGLGQRGHQGHRLQGLPPVVGGAAEALPLRHGHDEVEAGLLGVERDLLGVLIGRLRVGRGGGDHAAAVADRQEDAVLLAVHGDSPLEAVGQGAGQMTESSSATTASAKEPSNQPWAVWASMSMPMKVFTASARLATFSMSIEPNFPGS